jgi:amino acid transporter
MQPNNTFKKLTFFDVTNLLVGAIVGADIYVVASLGSQYLGPASLVAWIAAGMIAIIIALNFAECATIIPKVGGAYAYAREVWGNFAGFLVGWALWLAEVAALAVFPVAFVRYLTFFFLSLTPVTGAAIKLLFIASITFVNIRGTRLAGRTNDVLTIAKLSPLLLLIVAGLIYVAFNPALTYANFVPFAPLDFSHFGQALVLIFWAYAGFELAAIPSNEVENPTRTIPKAIIVGMAIVTLFYLLTNFVIIGVVNWTSLPFDTAPLATAGSVVFFTNAYTSACRWPHTWSRSAYLSLWVR